MCMCVWFVLFLFYYFNVNGYFTSTKDSIVCLYIRSGLRVNLDGDCLFPLTIQVRWPTKRQNAQRTLHKMTNGIYFCRRNCGFSSPSPELWKGLNLPKGIYRFSLFTSKRKRHCRLRLSEFWKTTQWFILSTILFYFWLKYICTFLFWQRSSK